MKNRRPDLWTLRLTCENTNTLVPYLTIVNEVLEAYLPYVEEQLARGRRLHTLSRHLLGLFQGCPGGRRYRRHLSENACREGAGCAVLREAGACVLAAQLDAALPDCA